MAHQGADQDRLNETIAQIRTKLVVLSGKGGVGKSTVAANLAVGLAQRSLRTGLLDSDLHGPSIPKMLGLESYTVLGNQQQIFPAERMAGNLKVMSVQFLLSNHSDSVIWRGPLKHAVISQFIGHTVWGTLDFLIVDSPPGTGDEPLSVVQTLTPDGAIIVTTPQEIATFDVRKSIDFCNRLDLPIAGIIENMSGFACPHCNQVTEIFGSGGGKIMAEETGIPFLGSLPIDPTCVQEADRGCTIIESEKNSPLASAFNEIIDQLLTKQHVATPTGS